MTNAPKIITSRRRLLLGAGAGAVALAAPSVWSPSRAAGKRIVVRDDGGIYTKAYGAVYYRPFTEATGIEVVGVQANAEPVAQIKTMVDTKNYTWDMAKISWPAIQILTTGTNHSELTVSGNVSDHIVGLAGDFGSVANHFPIGGGFGTTLAAAALRAAGVPEPEALTLAAAGGGHDVCHHG